MIFSFVFMNSSIENCLFHDEVDVCLSMFDEFVNLTRNKNKNNHRENVFANDMSANVCFITIFSWIMYRFVASKFLPFTFLFCQNCFQTRNFTWTRKKKQLFNSSRFIFDFYFFFAEKIRTVKEIWIGQKWHYHANTT
jgi:hypothetical protein